VKSLIKFDGKAVTKLIEVVSCGIGTLYKPRAIRTEADAEAYKIETLAKADAKRALIENDAKAEIIGRAQARLAHQEVNRQANIEDIVEKAIPHLEKEVSDEQVDEDWRTRFFHKAQDISNEEMQEVWARILASEVSKPGHVSFRTLEIVSNVSRAEAEVFSRACKLASQFSRIWKIGNESSFEAHGVTYSDILQLREAGLVHDGDNLAINHSAVPLPDGACFIVMLGKQPYKFRYKNNSNATHLKLGQVAFTKAGVEMCRLINEETNEKYINDLVKSYENKYEVEEMIAGKL
jgi:hypothetical protein